MVNNVKIKIYNSRGSTYKPILEFKNKWIPREGDTIVLEGRYWYVTGIVHNFDENEVIIYVQNNKGRVADWVNKLDLISN